MKLLTTVAILLFTAIQAFSQTDSIPKSPVDSTKYVPVYLTPAGVSYDTVATIEFSYVGKHNQLFYTQGYVLQENNLFKAPNGEIVSTAGQQQVKDSRGKRYYFTREEVKDLRCGCYMFSYKEPKLRNFTIC